MKFNAINIIIQYASVIELNLEVTQLDTKGATFLELFDYF